MILFAFASGLIEEFFCMITLSWGCTKLKLAIFIFSNKHKESVAAIDIEWDHVVCERNPRDRHGNGENFPNRQSRWWNRCRWNGRDRGRGDIYEGTLAKASVRRRPGYWDCTERLVLRMAENKTPFKNACCFFSYYQANYWPMKSNNLNTIVAKWQSRHKGRCPCILPWKYNLHRLGVCEQLERSSKWSPNYK